MLPSTSSKEEQFFVFILDDIPCTKSSASSRVTLTGPRIILVTVRKQATPGCHILIYWLTYGTVCYELAAAWGPISTDHTHTSNLNSAGLAVFSGNSNHTNSLYVMLHMLSSWGVWHLSTGWSVATNTGVFTWASRQRFVTSADSMPDLKWSAAALITGNDSPASGQRTRMSPYAGYLTAQIG